MSEKAARRKRILIIFVLTVISILTFLVLSFALLVEFVSGSISDMHGSVANVIRSVNEMVDDDEALINAYEDVAGCKKEVIGILTKKGFASEQELKERYELVDDDTVLNTLMNGKTGKERISAGINAGSTGFLMFVDKNSGKVTGYQDESINGSDCTLITTVSIPISRSGSVATDFLYISGINGQEKIIAGFPVGNGLKGISDANDTDTYIVTDVGTTVTQVLVMTSNLWLIYISVIFIAAQYSKYSLKQKNKEYGQFRQWLISIVPIACILVFVISSYLYSLLVTTNKFNYENLHAGKIRTTVESYKEQNAALEEWYSRENLNKCRMAADLVESLGRVPDREDMKEISDILHVQYTYRYDNIGKVTVTDAPYDNIVLSGDPENPTYEFRPLLKGVDSVVQDIRTDELSGEDVQYVGVSIRNEYDKADGFVQICMPAETLNRLKGNFSLESEVSRVGTTGAKEIGLFIDKESETIIYSSYNKLVDMKINDSSISNLNLKDRVNGVMQIGYSPFFFDVTEIDGGFLVLATPKVYALQGRTDVAMLLTGATFISMLAIIVISLFRYKKLQEKERKHFEAEEKAAAKKKKREENIKISNEQLQEAETKEWGLFISVADLLKEKNGKNMEAFEERWKEGRTAENELTPEERIGKTVGKILFVLSCYVVVVFLFIGIVIKKEDLYDSNLDTVSYLLYGNWDKGFNLYAVTMCLLILCISITFVGLLNRVLYRIARVSNTRVETICMLLRSSTKYVAGILIVYLCVGQFVEDATTLFATTGVISVIIGIGAKDLIGDILAGFFLVFEDAFQVGDMLNIDGWTGVVTSVGIRMTTLNSFGDDRHINNSDLKNIINMNSGAVRTKISVPIAYKEDLEKVEDILKKALPEWKEKIPGAVSMPFYIGVDKFEFNAVYLGIAVYCESSSRWAAERMLNKEVKLLFDKNGIKTAFERIPYEIIKKDGE